MTLKVGLIVGREWSFPPAFIEEVNGRDEGVVAEYVTLGGPRMDEPSDYAVIIDRISHEVPMYRTYLKHAALQGTIVINNPFMWAADDKFFEASLATALGVASPKTVVLPNKDYVPGIVHEESLRNLVYPLDWHGILDYIEYLATAPWPEVRDLLQDYRFYFTVTNNPDGRALGQRANADGFDINRDMITGATPESRGSLLELGRGFLQDGDEVNQKGFCDNGAVRIGFGEACGVIEG